jgi:hypothetical protein
MDRGYLGGINPSKLGGSKAWRKSSLPASDLLYYNIYDQICNIIQIQGRMI